MPRFQPRFTIRTLAIFVTLVCAYFGAWAATKRHIDEVQQFERGFWPGIPHAAFSPMPFIVQRDDRVFSNPKSGSTITYLRQYYLWLGRSEFKMPFSTPVDEKRAQLYDAQF